MAANDRIDALTGARFFAAFGILLHHFGADLVAGSPFAARFLDSLSSCVSFFFVLSGFILVHAYQATERRLSWKDFVLARLARVYPLYLIGLLVMAVPHFKYGAPYADWGPVEGWVSFGLSVLGLQAWIPRYASLVNAPGWSLSAEMFFYAVFPVAAWSGRRFLFGRPIASLALLWVGATAMGLLLEATVAADRSTLHDGIRFAGFHPLVRLPEFLMGMSLGALQSRGGLSPRAASVLWVACLGILLAALVAGGGGIWQTAFHNSLLSPLFCGVILGLANASDPVQRFLSLRPALLLGESSYALYILHFPYMVVFTSLLHRLDSPLPEVVRLVVYLLASVAISIAVHLGIEKPSRDAIRRRFLRPGPRTSHAHPSSPQGSP